MSDRHVLEHAYVAYSCVVVCWREGVRRNEEHSWKGSLMCCLGATPKISNYEKLTHSRTCELVAPFQVEMSDRHVFQHADIA